MLYHWSLSFVSTKFCLRLSNSLIKISKAFLADGISVSWLESSISKALECMPYIMQCFIKKPEDVEKGLAFDRKLYIVRRVFSHSNAGTYTVSM